MSIYRLERLFAPRSVALVGASPRAASVGRAILANLRAAGFSGPLSLVNARYDAIDGVPCVDSLADLPDVPDVVVIATPPPTIPAIVEQAASRGASAAVIITAGLGRGPGSLAEQCEQTARAAGLRLVGPNCLGVMVPRSRFNASFAAGMPRPGELALISQSGAVAAGMVEWAAQRAVGFSAMVSIGDQLDVDFGDLLDYFTADAGTRAILLYVEAIKDARKFMSAARAAARVKPVVVVKAGRHAAAAVAAATHTGALAGADAVYDAAFRRAGLLRVLDLDELFDAAETLGRIKAVPGRRLAILTNGGGIGVLAVDRLLDLGGSPAEISSETRARLDAVLPPTWSKSNPVDIIGDADAARYAAALDCLAADPQNDGLLVMNVQTALASATETAQAVARFATAQAATAAPKPIFAVWVGTETAVSDIFSQAGVPHFATEAEAVRGYMHLVRHHDAIGALMRTPPRLPADFAPDVARARDIVEAAVADGRAWLDPLEVASLFDAYAIPIVPAVFAATPEEAQQAAAPFLAAGDSVAVKISSRDITHKSDVGGVKLRLADAQAVRAAATEVLAAARAARPEARIEGVIVQPMIVRPKARELIAGLALDPTFGPVVVFGHGGTAVEVIDDKALALPPLDLALARDLMARTRVARMLAGYRDVAAVKADEVALVLVKLAQLAADLPQVRELDINPLLADESGVISLDARVAVGPVEARLKQSPYLRFAVRPYPNDWERSLRLDDGAVIAVRPIRPEDEDLMRAFLSKVSQEDLRQRFFAPLKEFGHAFIARLVQLDYARAMALAAIDPATGELVGSVRIHADANCETAEYGILLRGDFKGRGLGWKMMQLIIDYARAEGLRTIYGYVLRSNITMLRMCREFGFEVRADATDHPAVFTRLTL